MKRRDCVLLLAIATVAAAGCIVTEHAETHEAKGGTGVGFIDNSLDSFTRLEGSVGSAVHSGVASSDQAVADAYHFTAGLVTTDSAPDLNKLQRARRAEAKRHTSKEEIIEKVEKSKITIKAPILDPNTLDKLGLYLVWSTPLAEEEIRNIWLKDDLILLETQRDKLFGLNLFDGYARWSYGFLSPIDARPTVGNNTVWVATASTIHAIDAVEGTARWKNRVKFTITSPIYTIGDKQYAGSLERTVYAINGSDPYPDWHFSPHGTITSTPIVENNVVYVGAEDGKLYAYSYTRHDNLWRVKAEGSITADIVHDANNIYFGSEGADAYCVSKASGTRIWRFLAQGAVKSPVWLFDDATVLVAASRMGMYALDRGTGIEKWHDKTAIRPVARGRFLYVLTQDNTIKALNPADGSVAWEQSVAPFKLVPENLATDAITLCSADGQIFLIQEKGGMSLRFEKHAAGTPATRPAAPPAKVEAEAPTPAAGTSAAEADQPADTEEAPEETTEE